MDPENERKKLKAANLNSSSADNSLRLHRILYEAVAQGSMISSEKTISAKPASIKKENSTNENQKSHPLPGCRYTHVDYSDCSTSCYDCFSRL
jgi:hypothetical protein